MWKLLKATGVKTVGKILSSRLQCTGESLLQTGYVKGTFPGLLKCRLKLEKQKCLYPCIWTFWVNCSMLRCQPGLWSSSVAWTRHLEGRSQMKEQRVRQEYLKVDLFALGHCKRCKREAQHLWSVQWEHAYQISKTKAILKSLSLWRCCISWQLYRNGTSKYQVQLMSWQGRWKWKKGKPELFSYYCWQKSPLAF